MLDSSQNYILDTNVLIEAHRRYYSFDIAPAFWNFLIKSATNNIIQSVDRVYNEIVKGNDELTKWTVENFTFAFKDTKNNIDVLTNYGKLMQWADKQNQFTQAAIDEFARVENADPWVIAFAMTNNSIVVTHEVFNEKIKNKIPIPNVCAVFNVKYLDTFTLLRELNFKFQ